MNNYYSGDWSTRKIALGNIGVVSENQIKTNLDTTTAYGSGANISDVMVSKTHIYLVHMNLNFISMYNKNEDGSLGTKVATRNWYNDDILIHGISRSRSSVPTCYALYTKNEKDYFIGVNNENGNLYRWEINKTNASLSNRTAFTNVPATFASYSRGGWDGKDKIHFVNKENNRLYSFDINTHTWTNIITLDSFASYASSSFTGSGLLVDEENDEVYATSGANQTSGFLSAWKLSTGAYIGTISNLTTVTPPINGTTGSFQLNPVNRNVGYYFYGYDNSTIKVLDIVLENPGYQVSDYLCNEPPSISLIETNDLYITFTVNDNDGEITNLRITINDIEVKTFSVFSGEINYSIDYNDLSVGNNNLKIIVTDDHETEMIKDINVERYALTNDYYYFFTNLNDEICYLNEDNQSIVETEYIVENTIFIKSKIAEHSFNSIEEINLKIDDLNILKGYKIKLISKNILEKFSLFFKNVSEIETIIPKEFINITDVQSFETIDIFNRGTFNVIFSNKFGEWCYFDETKTKVIIDSLNNKIDLLNINNDILNTVLNTQSNNYTELETLLEQIYLYAKETNQLKLGILLPFDNEVQQIKINAIINGVYQPLILGQDYTYSIKQNEIDIVLSETYDSENKIRINLMK